MLGLRKNVCEHARCFTVTPNTPTHVQNVALLFVHLLQTQDYFEDHAAERQLLRHDKPLHKTPQVSVFALCNAVLGLSTAAQVSTLLCVIDENCIIAK